MSETIVPLSSKRHANQRLMPLRSYAHAASTHMALLLPNEFPLACSIYPIVFVRQNERFRSTVLLGLKESRNLFVGPDGRWLVSYIPAAIRRYPFSVIRRDAASDELVLCLDESSGLLSETEGKPLFNEDGSPTEIVRQTNQFFGEFVRFAQKGERLFNEEHFTGLLAPMKIQLSDGGEKTGGLTGAFHVDEKKLHELSDEAFLTLRKKGLIPLIYAHLLSLRMIQPLAERLRAAARRQPVSSKMPTDSGSGKDGLPDTFNFG
jgi:hypothetical protein